MEDRAHLERRFDAVMLDIYHEAAMLGYRPTRFLEMVQTHGGIETAHRLLATAKVQDGLGELFLLNRLDLTVEHHVLLPEFAPLFQRRGTADGPSKTRDLGAAGGCDMTDPRGHDARTNLEVSRPVPEGRMTSAPVASFDRSSSRQSEALQT
jgi:hypothetical protein